MQLNRFHYPFRANVSLRKKKKYLKLKKNVQTALSYNARKYQIKINHNCLQN